LWGVLGGFLQRVASSARAEVSAIGTNLLRSLGGRLLLDDGLSAFRFERVFMRTLLDAFQSQRSADSRTYMLVSLAGLVAECGDRFASGWEFVLQIIAAAARDSAARPAAFDLLVLIARTRAAALGPQLPTLVELLATFRRRGSRETAVLAPIAAALTLEPDSDLWIPLAAAADDPDSFADIASAAANAHAPALAALLEEGLPQFCAAGPRFFSDLFMRIAPAADRPLLTRILCDAIGRESVASGAVEAFVQFAPDALDAEEIAQVLDAAEAALPAIGADAIVALADAVSGAAAKVGERGRRFIAAVAEAEAEAEAGGERKAVLAAGAQLAMVRWLECAEGVAVEELAECVHVTMKMFVESGCVTDAESAGGAAWARAVREIVRKVNGYEGEQFTKCFAAGKEAFVALIVNASKDVRAEIGRVLQKGMTVDGIV
jgi:hypothetical protein